MCACKRTPQSRSMQIPVHTCTNGPFLSQRLRISFGQWQIEDAQTTPTTTAEGNLHAPCSAQLHLGTLDNSATFCMSNAPHFTEGHTFSCRRATPDPKHQTTPDERAGSWPHSCKLQRTCNDPNNCNFSTLRGARLHMVFDGPLTPP